MFIEADPAASLPQTVLLRGVSVIAHNDIA
jgi:hypothetical protein